MSTFLLRLADIMEQALYNGALSGLAIDGTRFFYDNPLESRGGHHRWVPIKRSRSRLSAGR